MALLTRGAQQVRVADTANPNLAGAQNVVVTVQQTQLSVVADTNVVAGVALNVTLSATDAYGNINANYTGTVHLTSSDPNATLPADVTFVPGNQGIVTLTHQTTFRTASLSQSLTATDSANGFVGTQSGIAVNPGPAAVLAVAPSPTVIAGAPFAVSVSAYDAYSNLATGYTGRISFSCTDVNATLPPASTFTLANLGSKTFASGARLLRAGPQLITAMDSNNFLTDSGATNVQSAAPSALAIAGPTTTVAGTPLSVTVTAFDPYGNVATGMNDTVTLTGGDASGTYPGAFGFGAADAGSKMLSGLTTLRTAGLVGLTATDISSAGVTSALLYLSVTPAPIASLVITAPSSVTAATPFSCVLSGVDPYMNLVSSYQGTVQLISTDAVGLPSPTAPFAVNFAAGSAAQRTVSGLRLMTAGSQNLSAEDANGILFGSSPIQVNPGAASALALGTPSSTVAGQAQSVTVTALDAGANVAPSFAGTITFSSTDVYATLPAAYVFIAGDHGQKSLPASLVYRTSGSQTLMASGAGLTTGSAATSVAPASPVGLQLYGLANVLAGGNNQATLRAVDTYGNTAPAYAGTISWTSSDTAASLPSSTNFTAADAGSKTVSLRLYTAGLQSVTATDAANNFAATQANVVVKVQRSRFVVISPNSTTAGTTLTLGVAATDAFNNLDTNYTGTLHFISTDPNAALPQGTTIATSDHGQRNVPGIVLTTTTSNANITVLDNTNNVIGTSGPIVVAPANATRLGVVTTSSAPAGTPLTATLTAYDPYNNVSTGYTGTVAISTTNANAILPAPATFAANSNGILAVSNIYLLSATNNTSLSAADTSNPNVAGSQAGIQVTPLAADHFVLTSLANGAAGHTNALTVVVRDMYNNIAAGYRGTITFTSSDPGASLPTNYTFLAGDQGTHTFAGVALVTVGTQSVTAQDTTNATIAGTQRGIVISGNSASHITLTGAASTVAGQAQNVLITAVDAYGNVDPNFAGAVTFSTTDPNATLAASYTFSTADAGTRLLPVTYVAATIQTLTATGPAGIGSTQINTAVVPANANAYVLAGIPNAPAGQATSVTVRVIDAYNNTVPLYRGQAHFTSSDTHASLPTDYAFVAADNGIKAVGLTLVTAGTQWVRATDANSPNIFGQQSGISVGVAQSHLQVSCNTNTTAGAPFAITVKAVDAYGNLNPNYAGTVHFTTGDPNASMPPDVIVTNANNGSISAANAILRVATANRSIIASDTNVSSYTGAQSGILVAPANANAVVLTGLGAVTAGVQTSATLTAYDAFNNVATGYTGTVSFSSTDGNATLAPTANFAASYAGIRTFTNAFTLLHAGPQTITASDVNNALVATWNVTVSAATPAALILAAPAASIAGNIIVAQVQAQDAYGNLASTYRGTVGLSSSDPNASYPASYAFLAADAGTHTFNANLILRQSGTQVVNAVDANNAYLGAGAAAISVSPAPIASLRVGAPASVTSESSFIATVTGLDAYGNVANTYAGTVQLSSSDPNGTPSSTTPLNLTFNSGSPVQRSVSGLLLNSGGNQILSARDANNPNALYAQAGVVVVPLTATAMSATGYPSTTIAGAQGNVTVRVYDNYGNIATGYLGTVHVTSTDPNATLSPNYTFVATDQGVHVLASTTLRTAGTQSLTVADTNGLSGTQAGILVSPNAPISIVLSGPATATAGLRFSVTATARDLYNNVATSYSDNHFFHEQQ